MFALESAITAVKFALSNVLIVSHIMNDCKNVLYEQFQNAIIIWSIDFVDLENSIK